MDLPEQALEMFNRFLAGKTFHDVVLPTDGTLNASPSLFLPSILLPFPSLLVEDIIRYAKYHRLPSLISPYHLSYRRDGYFKLFHTKLESYLLSPSLSPPDIQLNLILFVRANRSLVRTERRHDVHD